MSLETALVSGHSMILVTLTPAPEVDGGVAYAWGRKVASVLPALISAGCGFCAIFAGQL
jgi:hypothetical protein